MTHDYRTSSVWKKARHLVLALSLTADSLLAREKALSREIRRHSIVLLLRIVELCESGKELPTVESSIGNLEQDLTKLQKKGILTKSSFHRLAKEIGALRAAIVAASWHHQAGRVSGSTPHPARKPPLLTLSGVLHD